MFPFRPTLTSLDDRYAPSAGFTDPTPLSEYDTRAAHSTETPPSPVDLTGVPEWSVIWLTVGNEPTAGEVPHGVQVG